MAGPGQPCLPEKNAPTAAAALKVVMKSHQSLLLVLGGGGEVRRNPRDERPTFLFPGANQQI